MSFLEEGINVKDIKKATNERKNMTKNKVLKPNLAVKNPPDKADKEPIK